MSNIKEKKLNDEQTEKVSGGFSEATPMPDDVGRKLGNAEDLRFDHFYYVKFILGSPFWYKGRYKGLDFEADVKAYIFYDCIDQDGTTGLKEVEKHCRLQDVIIYDTDNQVKKLGY